MCFLAVFGFTLHAAEGWSPIQTIGSNDSFIPDIAVDNAGNAAAVFIQYDGSNQRIQSAIRPFGSDWTTPSEFLSPPGNDAEAPQVALSLNKGNAVAVWKLNTNSGSIIQFASLHPGSAVWSPAISLTVPEDVGGGPVVKVDSEGNALIVWSFFDGASYHIQAVKYLYATSNWISISDLIVYAAFEFDLAFDRKGNAVLVWEGRVGFKNVIQAATLSAGSYTWEQTADVSPSNTQSSFPKIGLDKWGNAIVVWSEGVAFTHIASAKLVSGASSWISTTDPTSADRSIAPDIAVDPAGNAVAIWYRIINNSISQVEVSTLLAGSFTWTPPVILASSLLITDPKVVVDKYGNAVAIWSASGVLQNALLPFGKSWTSPVSITPGSIGVGGQQIAMTPCAFAVIAYTAQVFASSEEVVQSVHSIGLFPPSPPKNLKGKVIKNKFLTQEDLIHRLTWDASDDSCIVKYFIRRNGELIGVVPSKDPLFFDDHNRQKKIQDNYTITAVKADGTESDAIGITLP